MTTKITRAGEDCVRDRAGAGEQEERRAKKTEGWKGEEDARIKERLRRKAQGENEMGEEAGGRAEWDKGT